MNCWDFCEVQASRCVDSSTNYTSAVTWVWFGPGRRAADNLAYPTVSARGRSYCIDAVHLVPLRKTKLQVGIGLGVI